MTGELKVFSSIAVRGVLETLVPGFEAVHDVRLDIGWNTAPALVKRLQAGETADVLILNRPGMDRIEGLVPDDNEPTTIKVPAELIVRDSTAAPSPTRA